jgi:hypothetical protein
VQYYIIPKAACVRRCPALHCILQSFWRSSLLSQCQSHAACLPNLQVNLFVAVLYSKFARAQRVYNATQQQGIGIAIEPQNILVRLWGWLGRQLGPLFKAKTWQRRVSPEGPAVPMAYQVRLHEAHSCLAGSWR